MRTTTRWPATRLAGLALTGSLAIVACGSGGSSTGAAVTTAITATTATTAATNAVTPTTTAPAATSPTTTKVSANDATRAELQAAFTTAGIPSPAQWAREVEEYRPYATDDPTLAKLRQNLAKYNPGPGVVDQIVATLTP